MKKILLSFLLLSTLTFVGTADVKAVALAFSSMPDDSTEVSSPTEGVVNGIFVEEPQMKDDILQILARFAMYMKKHFQECKEPNSLNESCGCFKAPVWVRPPAGP